MSNQISIPTDVQPEEIARKRSLGSALILCTEAAGYELDKQSQQDLGVDKAQFSRWRNDSEGILWPKLRRLMDQCGNHIPVFWMLHDLGYDIRTLRKRETELEIQLREEREKNARLEMRLEVLEEVAGVRK